MTSEGVLIVCHHSHNCQLHFCSHVDEDTYLLIRLLWCSHHCGEIMMVVVDVGATMMPKDKKVRKTVEWMEVWNVIQFGQLSMKSHQNPKVVRRTRHLCHHVWMAFLEDDILPWWCSLHCGEGWEVKSVLTLSTSHHHFSHVWDVVWWNASDPQTYLFNTL
jgi:hypothetical protein